MKALSGQSLLICIVSTILFVSTGFAQADKSDEINHLLEFIAQSDCIYIRNGKEYSALEARDHIAGKYQSVKWDKNLRDLYQQDSITQQLLGETIYDTL